MKSELRWRFYRNLVCILNSETEALKTKAQTSNHKNLNFCNCLIFEARKLRVAMLS